MEIPGRTGENPGRTRKGRRNPHGFAGRTPVENRLETTGNRKAPKEADSPTGTGAAGGRRPPRKRKEAAEEAGGAGCPLRRTAPPGAGADAHPGKPLTDRRMRAQVNRRPSAARRLQASAGRSDRRRNTPANRRRGDGGPGAEERGPGTHRGTAG
ncbi:hypothetical protein GCM10023082_46630 [Streptomyces tremellae]|uniref:Uncharacterized protein n=1 Tax=Streptomyces tremellae TaxID=1124239 RepID=A0ABP7FNW1_9ACTN